MLSLDGPLRYLPFGALYDGHAYVAESYRTVMYAEVARDKVALPSKQQWKVAALGVSDKVSADFPPLPNVPAELHAIVKSSTGGIYPGEIRLNKNFTEKTMAETSIRNPVVHIASHFRFVPGTDRDSFLLLGDGSKLSLDQLRKANFFQESELLTLSACETAMGGTGKGVEIEGFAAIAMNQGAKSVIATLWPISDKSTAILMKEFYRLRMEKKLTKAEALRQSQLELLKGKLTDADNKLPENERGGDHTRFKKDKNAPYSHPYYWAPFILIGNWK
jgi:CHAT domain-containing protein